ncbi:OLC1v1005678C1 [Oldenlandia corymbosa var. corymbosa]|uniref:OLC1v1005678C1 n=1 Tax=Oldenlandia corymbosa var. corymbosa TaxID=529605 RepID=A0AAV1DFU5_OLDCO|nr:OLC1v1005678C1 [Oldenlandia corymbosa var. corymbosa]
MAKLALMMEEKKKKKSSELILEINLVSAQGLKVRSKSKSKTRTYAVVWVDDVSSNKLRTGTDGLSRATAAFNVEIYTVGHRHFLKDSLVGTARCLLSNLLGKMITPVHVHRPSGNFHGILNVSASLCDEKTHRSIGFGYVSGIFRS